VMRRCSTSMAVLTALLALGFGTQPNLARADAINPNASISTATVDYRLTSSSTIPVPPASLTSPQVVAMIVPTGSVVPPTNSDGTEGSPLTILPDYLHLVWRLPAIQFSVSPAYNPVIETGQVLVSIWLAVFGYAVARRVHGLSRFDSVLVGVALELLSLGSLVLRSLGSFILPAIQAMDHDRMVITATLSFPLAAAQALNRPMRSPSWKSRLTSCRARNSIIGLTERRNI